MIRSYNFWKLYLCKAMGEISDIANLFVPYKLNFNQKVPSCVHGGKNTQLVSSASIFNRKVYHLE